MKERAAGRAQGRLLGVFLGLTALWGGALGYRHYYGDGLGLNGLENLSLDLRFRARGPRPAPDDVVIVALDEDAIRAAGGFPLRRGALARIVAALAATKPAVLAIDMAFIDPGDAAETEALAQALRSGPAVVASIGQVGASRAGLGAPVLADVVAPVPAIAAAARQGLANIDTDSGGVARFAPMVFDTPDGPDRSFALAAVSLARNAMPVLSAEAIELGDLTIPTDYGYYAPINYYGPAATFRQIGAARVLHGELAPEETRGRVVLIGATALGVADKFASPFDAVMPGVEVWATAIGNALAGEGLVVSRATRSFDVAAALALPASAILLLELSPTLAGALGAALALLVLAGATMVAFGHGYWLSVSVPLASYVPLVTSYAVTRILAGQTRLRRAVAQKDRLGVFQSPRLVAAIADDPEFLKAPVRLELTVLFVDISGSTGMAEALGLDSTHARLADFQRVVDREIGAHGGILIAYIGDGALAIFGFPKPDGVDAARALAAVDALAAALDSWLGQWPLAGGARLDFRIGAHFGPVLVSRIGPADHQQITVTGDTVNVANRLLGVAKEHNCRLMVTEDLVAEARRSVSLDARERTAPPFTIPIRGRREPVRVRVWG